MVRRKFVSVEMTDPEYFKYIGGNTPCSREKARFICYNFIKDEIFNQAIEVLKSESIVFIVAYNTKIQKWLDNKFKKEGINCLSRTRSVPNNFSSIGNEYQVVITTSLHLTGYNLPRCKTMITSVYPICREMITQMEWRIRRLSDDVDIIILETGILSNMKYNCEDDKLKKFDQIFKNI